MHQQLQQHRGYAPEDTCGVVELCYFVVFLFALVSQKRILPTTEAEGNYWAEEVAKAENSEQGYQVNGLGSHEFKLFSFKLFNKHEIRD